MYRLLIVDNESIIVDGLAELFRRQHVAELEVIGAYSSLEAMRIKERCRIDVALLDIRMPGMNGLELQKAIIAKWPRCKVVLLSGHSDFAYIQEAMRCGGFDYLLKTEGDDVIIRAVSSAFAAISREMEQEALLTGAKDQIKRAFPSLQNEFVRHLLQGSIPASKLAESFRELEIPLNREHPVLLVIGKIDEWDEGFRASDKSLIGYAVRNIVEEYLSDTMQIFSAAYDPTVLCWFIQSKQEAPAAEDGGSKSVRHYVQETFELIQLTCRNLLDKPVSFFIGKQPVEWMEAAETFERLKRLMSFHFDMRESILIDEVLPAGGECKGAFDPDLALQLKKIALLGMMLENGRLHEFLQTFSELSSAFSQIQDNRYKVEVFFSLSAIFLSYLNRWNLYQTFEIEVTALQRIRTDGLSWEELTAFFRNFAERIFKQKVIGIEDHHSELIKRVHWYVETYLANDISLTSIAEFTGHSPSYLSRLYKQISGTGLSGFITETRLSRAKSLLEKNQLKISEISEAVGFVSEPSFYRFFKKATGRTPQEFRDSAFLRH